MGDRALIQLKNATGGVSPVLYLHWGGSDIAAILECTQAQMKGRANDVDYSFARLVQRAIGSNVDNTGFGVWNQETLLNAGDSHGDAGCFVVDVTSGQWVVTCMGGYGLEGAHSLKVSTEAVA